MSRHALGLAALLALATPAAAQDAPMTERTEKLQLKPHRVKGLLLGYGYTVGEFTGEVRTRASSARAPMFSSDKATTEFTLGSPRSPAPVAVSCGGGQSRLALGWIEFKRQDLAYVCSFQGGPPDAAFALALSDAGMMARLYQPQRAAELTWGGITVRAHTRKVEGAMPIGGGGTMSYVITRDGQEIGGLVRGVLQPTFYLPPAGSPDRDAAAVMALALYTFADPANQN
jgi:hypothetical protein